MSVEAARADLVTEPFSRKVAVDATAPGSEQTIITAINGSAGATAYLTRVAPLAIAGVGRWRAVIHGACFRFAIGETITLSGDGAGAAAGTHVVTGKDEDLQADRVTLTLRGPDPEA